MFISWMLITLSFKKSLTVEQFQGNYLNANPGLKVNRITTFSYTQMFFAALSCAYYDC